MRLLLSFSIRCFAVLLLLLCIRETRAQSATLYIDSVRQWLASPKPDTGKLYLFTRLAQLPDCIPDTLLHYETQFYTYAEKHGLTAALPDALYAMGVAYFRSSKPSEAIAHFYRAAQGWDKAGDHPLQLARAYEMIATIHKAAGHYTDALQYYRQAFHLKKTLQNEQLLMSTYNGMGNAFRALDQADSAIFYLKKSLALSMLANNTLAIAQVTNNLGNIYWQQRSFSEARNWYSKALQSFETLQNAEGIAEACFNLGTIAFKQEDYSKAISYFNKSLQSLSNGQPLEHLEWIYRHLADAYAFAHEYEKAYSVFVKYADVKDSIYSIASAKAVADVREKYESEKKEQALLIEKERTAHLSQLNRNSRWLIYLLIAVAVLIALLGTFLVSNSRKQQLIAAQLAALKQQENERLIREQALQNNIAMLEGQEAERQRISMDLHDRLGGTLASLKFMIQSLYVKDNNLPPQAAKMDLLLQDALKDVRGISQNMSVGILHKYGLAEALQDLKETAESTGTLQVMLSLQGTARLPKQKAVEVYYIIRELVTNVIKHSRATELYIQCLTEEEVLLLTVEDNGIGFDTTQRAKGIGLTNIEARAHKIHATLEIETTPGKGTSFFFRIPIA